MTPSPHRPFSRRQFLKTATGLGALIVLGGLPGAVEAATLPALTAAQLTDAMAGLPRTGYLRLPGGGTAKVSDLRAAAAAFAVGDTARPDPATNPVAALGVLCALAAWAEHNGTLDLAASLPRASLRPLRLALPHLPGGRSSETFGSAVPPALVVRPRAALILIGTLPGHRVLAALEDPARQVAGHPRLELALLRSVDLAALLAVLHARLDATGTVVLLASGSKVALRPIASALASRLLHAAGVRFVDHVPIQPPGASTPVLTDEPVVPAPPAAVVPSYARVSQASDGRVLALDGGGTAVGRAEYIGGSAPWRWQGSSGLEYALREYADGIGLRIGCAPHGWLIMTDAHYALVVDQEFNSENLAGPGWNGLQASEGAPLELGYWKSRVARAQGAAQPMLGNLLLQNSRDDLPAWMNVDTVAATELRAAARDLITKEVTGLPGVSVWNVFNEPVTTSLYGHTGNRYYLDRLGADFRPFIADALGWAHEANPAATLIINDDYTDGRDPAVTAGYLDLASYLLGRGAPLGGVGLEMHLHYDESNSASGLVLTPSMFADALASYRSLGLQILVTEFDVDMTGFTGPKADEEQWQADLYRMALETALDGGVRNFSVFGLTDPTGWYNEIGKPHADALMFNGDYTPKPAYNAVVDVLKAELRKRGWTG